MRPKSIASFERLYLLAILIEVASIALHWSELAAGPPEDRWGRLAAIPIVLLLVLLTSRWRLLIAGILLAALFALTLPATAGPFMAAAPPVVLLPLAVQILLQIVGLIMLSRPESRAWLTATRADPDFPM